MELVTLNTIFSKVDVLAISCSGGVATNGWNGQVFS